MLRVIQEDSDKVLPLGPHTQLLKPDCEEMDRGQRSRLDSLGVLLLRHHATRLPAEQK